MAADHRTVRALARALAVGPLAASAVAVAADAGDAHAPAAKAEMRAALVRDGGKRPAGATHAWIDRGVHRPMTVDPSMRADFSGALQGKSVHLRTAGGPLADVPAGLQSPVLRDESGRAHALPGGVLVVFDADVDDDDARARIARHGASAVRRVADRVWLVEAPAGLESLELANRLARTGAFGAAQPNWWVERALK